MKSAFTSKTLWVNVIAFLAVVWQLVTANQLFGITPEVQAAIITVINFILRLVTNTGIKEVQ